MWGLIKFLLAVAVIALIANYIAIHQGLGDVSSFNDFWANVQESVQVLINDPLWWYAGQDAAADALNDVSSPGPEPIEVLPATPASPPDSTTQ